MKIIGEVETLFSDEPAVRLLKTRFAELDIGDVIFIDKEEWIWKTPPHKMIYHQAWRGNLPFSVSCKSEKDGWYLQKKLYKDD